jgi:hypothetical protein
MARAESPFVASYQPPASGQGRRGTPGTDTGRTRGRAGAEAGGGRTNPRRYAPAVYRPGYTRQQPSEYSGAICRSGHIIDMFVVDPNSRMAYDVSARKPRRVDNFCANCGSPVLFDCPSCEQLLPGYRPGHVGRPEADDFCRRCGGPFPWTSRSGKIARLRDLLANEKLDDHDRMEAQEALDVLTTSAESHTTEEQRKRALGKLKSLASAGWWNVAMPILNSFLSAELRRQAGLPPT